MIFVHHARKQILVEAAPVRANAYRLFVFQGELDDGRELRIALAPETDVAGIDAIFRERFGTGRLGAQQLMAVVMKIADQRHTHAHHVEALANLRHGRRGLGGVDSQAHEFRANAREFGHLFGCADDIGGIGIGHGLHHHRGGITDPNRADPHRHARAPRHGSRGEKDFTHTNSVAGNSCSSDGA